MLLRPPCQGSKEEGGTLFLTNYPADEFRFGPQQGICLANSYLPEITPQLKSPASLNPQTLTLRASEPEGLWPSTLPQVRCLGLLKPWLPGWFDAEGAAPQ